MTLWPKCATSKTAKSGNYAEDTWWTISEAERESFQIAYDGVDPETGEPLVPSGDRFVLWAVCGDGDFIVNDLHFPHWSSDDICLGRCLAKRSTGPWAYNEFRPHASEWIKRSLSAAYLADNLLAPHHHPWFKAPGVTVFMLAMDSMHNLDQNGCRSHLLGSLLFEFVYIQYKDLPRKVALSKVFGRITELYNELGTDNRLGRITLDMFTDSQKPQQVFACLSTAVKAAEQRHLTPVFVQLCTENNSGSDHDRLRLQCIKALDKFDSLSAKSPTVPSPTVGKQMKAALHLFLVSYQGLASWAASNGYILYQSVPKFHYTYHMAEQAEFLNPRAVWTYGFEDLVGIMITLAHACTLGTPALNVGRKAMDKYRLAMHHQLQKQWD